MDPEKRVEPIALYFDKSLNPIILDNFIMKY